VVTVGTQVWYSTSCAPPPEGGLLKVSTNAETLGILSVCLLQGGEGGFLGCAVIQSRMFETLISISDFSAISSLENEGRVEMILTNPLCL
jgi:hypothetical protein